jgi:hypothetical protein
MQIPEMFCSGKRNLITAVTNALSCSTSTAAVRPNPLTTAPFPFRKKARSSRAAFQMPNDRRAFRLRFRDGRSAAAPFPPSLRLRFTFPFAEPQAEAHYDRIGRKIRVESERQACCLLDGGWC